MRITAIIPMIIGVGASLLFGGPACADQEVTVNPDEQISVSVPIPLTEPIISETSDGPVTMLVVEADSYALTEPDQPRVKINFSPQLDQGKAAIQRVGKKGRGVRPAVVHRRSRQYLANRHKRYRQNKRYQKTAWRYYLQPTIHTRSDLNRTGQATPRVSISIHRSKHQGGWSGLNPAQEVVAKQAVPAERSLTHIVGRADPRQFSKQKGMSIAKVEVGQQISFQAAAQPPFEAAAGRGSRHKRVYPILLATLIAGLVALILAVAMRRRLEEELWRQTWVRILVILALAMVYGPIAASIVALMRK